MHESELLQRIDDAFIYDRERGVLIIRKGKRAGEVAGWRTEKGRLCVSIKNRNYFIHRLIWLIEYGEWPKYQIDHIDRNPENNRISNLRDVDASTNQHNSGAQRNSITGVRGVCFVEKYAKPYVVQVNHQGRRIHFSMHSTLEDATRTAETVYQGIR